MSERSKSVSRGLREFQAGQGYSRGYLGQEITWAFQGRSRGFPRGIGSLQVVSGGSMKRFRDVLIISFRKHRR